MDTTFASKTSLNGKGHTLEQLELFDTGLLSGIRNGGWLEKQEFPELEYAIPGLIPEGMTLLIGPPKAGKSWMLLSFCLAVATGGEALNAIQLSNPKRVLYLALEDGDRRMQSRCRALLGFHQPIPRLFDYLTAIRPGQMNDLLREYLSTYPDTGMVVIDTLGKIMPPSAPGESAYQRDYRVASEVKQIADDNPGLAVVVAHHDRKAASEDFVDAVSGTHGLAGAADAIAVLCRKRQSSDAILKVTGRDITEGEYALVMDGAQWQLAGNDLESAAAAAKSQSDRESLGDTANQVLTLVQGYPKGIRRADVQKKFPDVQVDVYLGRLVSQGRIDKMERGIYVPL
jgi:RecA-family ATPase